MVVESLGRHHLTAWVLVLMTQALVLMTGCGRSAPAAGHSGTAVVIFIHFSASVTGEDRASFRRETEAEMLPSLSAGAARSSGPAPHQGPSRLLPPLAGSL